MNNIPYDLSPDDDTEEMEMKEYRPLPPRDEWEFPDPDLLPELNLDILEEIKNKRAERNSSRPKMLFKESSLNRLQGY